MQNAHSPSVKSTAIGGYLKQTESIMNQIKETVQHDAVRVRQYIISFFKWTLIALVTGAVGGGIGAGFRYAITWATDLRTENPWLCYLLPAGAQRSRGHQPDHQFGAYR